jgi:hypothetical protein
MNTNRNADESLWTEGEGRNGIVGCNEGSGKEPAIWTTELSFVENSKIHNDEVSCRGKKPCESKRALLT